VHVRLDLLPFFLLRQRSPFSSFFSPGDLVATDGENHWPLQFAEEKTYK